MIWLYIFTFPTQNSSARQRLWHELQNYTKEQTKSFHQFYMAKYMLGVYNYVKSNICER